MATNYEQILRQVKLNAGLEVYDSIYEYYGFFQQLESGEVTGNDGELQSVILQVMRDAVNTYKPISFLKEAVDLRVLLLRDDEMTRLGITKKFDTQVYKVPNDFIVVSKVYDSSELLSRRQDTFNNGVGLIGYRLDSRGLLFVNATYSTELYMDYYYSPTKVDGSSNLTGLNQLPFIDKAFIDLIGCLAAYDVEMQKGNDLTKVLANLKRLAARFQAQNKTGQKDDTFTQEDQILSTINSYSSGDDGSHGTYRRFLTKGRY